MKYALTAIFLSAVAVLSAQTSLTIEGQSYSNGDDTWYGVNITRTQPTTLIFRNNSITSINRYGYLLSAGDEVIGAYNNNLDGAVISGNVLTWNGTPTPGIIPHGIFTGYNINVKVKYNYLNKVPMAIIRKSDGMTDVSGAVAYNIVKDPGVGVVVKGMNGVRIYNNTFYSSLTSTQTERALVEIYENPSVTPAGTATGTKIFNNVFYTKNSIRNISITAACRSGFESDYNVFYCEAGTPVFSVDGSRKTFAEWQALGYDTHSKVINPNFKDFVNFISAERLDYGTDLGSAWNEGLSVNAKWGTTSPETATQNGTWQVGAVIHKAVEVIVTPPPTPSFSGAVITEANPARVDLTFSLSLATVTPATSAFVVSVNGASRAVTGVSVSGTRVYLTLSSQVVYGDIVTVAYTKPSTNPLQTSEGGEAASFTAQAVTNNRTAPVNSPPAISISSPTKSTAFIAPATVTIEATASDSDGSVAKVEFYNGTAKLGELTSAPWSYTWKEVSEGTYSITATATDNSGSRTVSAVVTVVVEKAAPAVNQLPSVTISSPSDNDSFEVPATVTLTAEATDPDGTVTRVEYYIDGVKAGESLVTPFSFEISSDTAGTVQVIAMAYDNLNATASSTPVTISFSKRKILADMVNLYPSPNNGTFTIDLDTNEETVQEVCLEIISMTGRTVYSDYLSTEESTKHISMTEAFPGIYILRVTEGGRILTTRRFIKY